MYPVSDKYIAARRAAFREERITGGIKLKDGTIIAVDDSVLVQGSLSITSKVCTNDRFDIGSANCSVMSLKIKDKNAYDHEFGGALIKLTYGIVVETAEDGTKIWESVPLPPFFVGASSDSDSCVRKRDMVTLKAYDTMSLLDINFPDTIPSDSMWSALVYVCNRAGIGLAITEDEFSALPNSDIVPDFSGESIESCRDVVMWIAQTTGCCAFCDYRGLLMLKAYKYEGSNNYDRLFTANERKTIEYSDTRTYLAYLQAYVGDDKVQYSQVTTWTGTDAPHIKEGVLSLPKNPILRKLTTAQQEAINQSYFTNRSYPTRYIKADCFVDPALELLDVVAFSGGNIDVGQIINVATQIKWKYRGKGTIYCASVAEAADTALEESSQSAEAVSLSALSDTADTADAASESDIIKVQPRSQTEKQIDELRSMMGGAATSAERLLKKNTDNTESILEIGKQTIDFKLGDDRLLNILVRNAANMAASGFDGFEVYVNGRSNYFTVGLWEDSGIKLRAGNNALSISENEVNLISSNINFSINSSAKTTRISDGTNNITFINGVLRINGKKVLTED